MKTTRTILLTIGLAALPSIGFAQCTGLKHQEASISCADGMIWDTEKQACVAVTG